METCPVHDKVCFKCGERVYRCSRCGGCYQCEHQSIYLQGKPRWVWRCKDGQIREAICEECDCDRKAKRGSRPDLFLLLLAAAGHLAVHPAVA